MLHYSKHNQNNTHLLFTLFRPWRETKLCLWNSGQYKWRRRKYTCPKWQETTQLITHEGLHELYERISTEPKGYFCHCETQFFLIENRDRKGRKKEGGVQDFSPLWEIPTKRRNVKSNRRVRIARTAGRNEGCDWNKKGAKETRRKRFAHHGNFTSQQAEPISKATTNQNAALWSPAVRNTSIMQLLHLRLREHCRQGWERL